MKKRDKGWIQLPSGNKYYPLNPKKHIPSLDDIAHKGAQTNRFTGSCLFPYSINQHQYLGARAIMRDLGCKKTALAFLFHDTAEPFGFGDLPAPIKQLSSSNLLVKAFVFLHGKFEKRILDTIIDKYGITRDHKIWQTVKEYDIRIIRDERDQVMASSDHDWDLKSDPLLIDIQHVCWKTAKNEWLNTFYSLVG